MRSKPKPKTTKRKGGDKAQVDRFKDAARKADADESGAAFEKAVRQILPARHATKP